MPPFTGFEDMPKRQQKGILGDASNVVDFTMDTEPLPGEAPEAAFERLLAEMKLPVAERYKLTQERIAKRDARQALNDAVGEAVDAAMMRRGPTVIEMIDVADRMDLRVASFADIKTVIERRIQSMGPRITANQVRDEVVRMMSELKPAAMEMPNIEFKDVGNGQLEITIEMPVERVNVMGRESGSWPLDLKRAKWANRLADENDEPLW